MALEIVYINVFKILIEQALEIVYFNVVKILIELALTFNPVLINQITHVHNLHVACIEIFRLMGKIIFFGFYFVFLSQ